MRSFAVTALSLPDSRTTFMDGDGNLLHTDGAKISSMRRNYRNGRLSAGWKPSSFINQNMSACTSRERNHVRFAVMVPFTNSNNIGMILPDSWATKP